MSAARLGELVRAERRSRFGSVEKATRVADVSRATWKRVEEGQRVRDDRLTAIEHALGWTPGRAWLIINGDGRPGGDDPGPTSPDPVEQAIHESGLSGNGKELMIAQYRLLCRQAKERAKA